MHGSKSLTIDGSAQSAPASPGSPCLARSQRLAPPLGGAAGTELENGLRRVRGLASEKNPPTASNGRVTAAHAALLATQRPDPAHLPRRRPGQLPRCAGSRADIIALSYAHKTSVFGHFRSVGEALLLAIFESAQR